MFNLPGLPFNNFAPPWLISFLVLWEVFWKAVALWYTIRNNQRNWFVAIFILSTVGILPILYLKFWQQKQK